jgi:hypothetical protein
MPYNLSTEWKTSIQPTGFYIRVRNGRQRLKKLQALFSAGNLCYWRYGQNNIFIISQPVINNLANGENFLRMTNM